MYIFPVVLSLNLSPIFILASFPFLPPLGDSNGLRPKISLPNPGLSVLPFFQDRRGRA
jgi:hypothetical protein